MDDAPEPPPDDDGEHAAAAWSGFAAALAPHLARAAGPGARPVSIALELSQVDDPACAVTSRAWVERATRTLVFLGAEARTRDGALAAAATAVFRRG